MPFIILSIFNKNMSTQSRINEIDLLRFCAAIMVVIFHFAFRGYAADNMTQLDYSILAPAAKYGFLGVQLFFMISGFVIMMTADGSSAKKFIISRAIRLYPAFWICCSITFLVSLFLGGDIYHVTIEQYLINMTMLSQYFGIASVDGSYWSLFIEIQFYALMLIIILLRKTNKIENIALGWLIITIAAKALSLFSLREIFITEHSAFFISGIVFYLVWKGGITKKRMLLILASMCWAIPRTIKSAHGLGLSYHTAYDPIVVSMIILLFFIAMFLVSTRNTGVFKNISWTMLGALTYPLYLLHQNVGFIMFNHLYGKANVHLVFWSVIIAMLVISYCIHRFVEIPLAKWMKCKLRRDSVSSEIQRNPS